MATIHYYVSVQSGDDTNDGMSSETAWKTLTHAAAQVPEPNEGYSIFVHIAPGTYREKITPVNSGRSADELIVYAGDENCVYFPGELPGRIRITGCDEKEVTSSGSVIDCSGKWWIEFWDVHVDGSKDDYICKNVPVCRRVHVVGYRGFYADECLMTGYIPCYNYYCTAIATDKCFHAEGFGPPTMQNEYCLAMGKTGFTLAGGDFCKCFYCTAIGCDLGFGCANYSCLACACRTGFGVEGSSWLITSGSAAIYCNTPFINNDSQLNEAYYSADTGSQNDRHVAIDATQLQGLRFLEHELSLGGYTTSGGGFYEQVTNTLATRKSNNTSIYGSYFFGVKTMFNHLTPSGKITVTLEHMISPGVWEPYDISVTKDVSDMAVDEWVFFEWGPVHRDYFVSSSIRVVFTADEDAKDCVMYGSGDIPLFSCLFIRDDSRDAQGRRYYGSFIPGVSNQPPAVLDYDVFYELSPAIRFDGTGEHRQQLAVEKDVITSVAYWVRHDGATKKPSVRAEHPSMETVEVEHGGEADEWEKLELVFIPPISGLVNIYLANPDIKAKVWFSDPVVT